MNKDLEIIKQLRTNSRYPLIQISKKTGIPLSTVFDRIKHNEKNIIARYTSLVDFNKLGFGIRVFTMIQTTKAEQMCNYFQRHNSINSMFRINGQYNIFIDAVFSAMSEYLNFVSEMNQFEIQGKTENFVLETIHNENFLTGKGDENG